MRKALLVLLLLAAGLIAFLIQDQVSFDERRLNDYGQQNFEVRCLSDRQHLTRDQINKYCEVGK